MTDQWSHEYNRLVRRFRHVIVGQFYGHTHFDEFEVFFARDNKKAGKEDEAVSVAYLAPSITPINGINPAYRIYTTDGESRAA